VPGRKSVCVASAIGRTFGVQVVGVMVFGNSYDRVPIESWGMDDAAVATIRRVLGKDYNVRRLPVSQAAVSAFENSNDYGGFLRSTAAGAGKCDVYLTLTPIGRPLGNTNQYYGGLGMLDMSRMMFERVFIFASFVVRAYDGNNSMNLLKSVRSGRFEQQFELGGLASTYRKIDKSWWPTPASAAAQSARLKTATRALVEEGVTQTLKEVFEGA
jgi:hypothetical protein